jgi:16S rRNA (cytidine1402-2'-O)-methyltransferase
MESQLILIPQTVAGNSAMLSRFDLTAHLTEHLPHLDGLFAESLSGGRQFLKKLQRHIPIVVIDKKTPLDHIKHYLADAKGQTWAFVSDCGYPCIADPGSTLVQQARSLQFKVHLFPGTSAILGAITLSGIIFERFCFQGYLPRDSEPKKQALQHLEQISRGLPWQPDSPCLQVFIETPYRHQKMVTSCLDFLMPETLLCVASEIGNEDQLIRTLTVKQWKIYINSHPEEERVAVYMILAQKAQIVQNRVEARPLAKTQRREKDMRPLCKFKKQ